ncbi:MAG: hypothetical protein C0483_09260 [Pirellula sp.]|nr:hypothetical protein [Pirellula sp.]
MKLLLSLVALLVAAGSAAEADAQWGWQGYPQFYGRNVYTVYDQDRLPYFSLHPPVYYSRPVPRTYGYSPFAYPGIVKTPDLPVGEPQIVVNPYFDGAPKEPAPPAEPPKPTPAPDPIPRKTNSKAPGKNTNPSANKSAQVTPLRIINPHAYPVLTTSLK